MSMYGKGLFDDPQYFVLEYLKSIMWMFRKYSIHEVYVYEYVQQTSASYMKYAHTTSTC